MNSVHDLIKNHALNLVNFIKNIDNIDETTKKEWCTDQLTAALELFDDKIPVIGMILDLKVVDGMERRAVSQLVNWAFLKIESDMKSKQT